MNEIEQRQSIARARPVSWISEQEKPVWMSWFGLYPARSSVEAAKCQLRAMGYGLMMSIHLSD